MSDIHRCDQTDHLRDLDERVGEMGTVLFGPKNGEGGFIRDTKETMELFRKGFSTLNDTVTKIHADVRIVAEKGMTKVETLKAWAPIVASVGTLIGIVIVAIIASKAGQPVPMPQVTP